MKDFYPPGQDTNDHFDEILITSSSCIDSTVTAAWNAASATQAAARTNLTNIRIDFENAQVAMDAVGMTCTDVIMNSTTLGYIITQEIAGGWEHSWAIVREGRWISSIFGLNIIINNQTYVHPVDGTVTDYIADGEAIFVDGDNGRTGRRMIECEAAHVKAPANTMGLFFDTYIEEEAPGRIIISGEWTGMPMIPVPCSQYIYTDVTAT